jgi:hypothetical protein
MARVQITIDFPDWSAEELRQAVRDIDALDDPVPIAVENVDVKDILTYVFGGQVGADHVILQQSIDGQEMEDKGSGYWRL